VAVLNIVTTADSSQLMAYSEQYTTFLQIFRLPLVLGIAYYKNILKIGNMTKL